MTPSPPSDQPSQHSLFLLARRRQRPSSHRLARLARSRTTNRVTQCAGSLVHPVTHTHPSDPNRSQRPPRSSFLKPHTAAKSP